MRFLHAFIDSFFAWLDEIRERHILPFAESKKEGEEK